MSGIPDGKPTKPPMSDQNFLNVLVRLDELMKARLIAWDVRSSQEAEDRLLRLTQRVKDIRLMVVRPFRSLRKSGL
jgi:hypothetical protein